MTTLCFCGVFLRNENLLWGNFKALTNYKACIIGLTIQAVSTLLWLMAGASDCDTVTVNFSVQCFRIESVKALHIASHTITLAQIDNNQRATEEPNVHCHVVFEPTSFFLSINGMPRLFDFGEAFV